MSKAAKTWDVIDPGEVPQNSPSMEYSCPNCGREACLPVLGLPLAQLAGGGVVFEPGHYAMPRLIRCRGCRRVLEGA